MKELCKACNIAQAEKVCAVLGLEEIERERLTALVKSYLEKADMAKTTPQIMGHICGILAEATGCDDPYGELKASITVNCFTPCRNWRRWWKPLLTHLIQR